MRIAIAGYGVEGEANYKYWSRDLGNDITIVDEKLEPTHTIPEGAKTLLGEGSLQKLDGYDLVVRTAGLAPYKIKTNGKIWSATNEFFEKCPADIIGVTGSKGKGTTCSLITSILRADGKTVHLVGNIGEPALDALDSITPDDIVVYELSSFQLWDIEKAPKVSVLLMVEPDHLDVHRNLQEYLDAKSNIIDRSGVLNQGLLFYNSHNSYVHEMVEKYRTQALEAAKDEATPEERMSQLKTYGDPATSQVYVKEGNFYDREHIICSVDELRVPGEHNKENACAAISAALQYTHNYEAIKNGLNNFTGLPHRLKLVKELNGVKYYDDSIATTPGSAIAALNAFQQPKILILGGSSKGADFAELAKKVTDTTTKKVILVGEEAPHIKEALLAMNYTDFIELGTTTMGEIVSTAQKNAESGDIVILSPSCASFDMFKSYSDRGDQFIAAVNSL